MDLTTLQQEIGERLRYRDVPEIVGRGVVINAISSIEWDVTQTLLDILPTQYKLVDTYSPILSIKKLGILTLDFTVPSIILENNYETGNELLKRLGYIENPEVRNAYRIWTAIFNSDKAARRDLMGLGDLLEDINGGQTYFKIEFKVDKSPQRLKGVGRKDLYSQLPNDYLPGEFKVKRACFTNSKLVWLHTYGIGVSIL